MCTFSANDATDKSTNGQTDRINQSINFWSHLLFFLRAIFPNYGNRHQVKRKRGGAGSFGWFLILIVPMLLVVKFLTVQREGKHDRSSHPLFGRQLGQSVVVRLTFVFASTSIFSSIVEKAVYIVTFCCCFYSRAVSWLFSCVMLFIPRRCYVQPNGFLLAWFLSRWWILTWRSYLASVGVFTS